MTALSVGISAFVLIVFTIFQLRVLQSDFELTETFILETVGAALANDQPILVQSSLNDFWNAFSNRSTSIEGYEIYRGRDLISQVAKSTSLKTYLESDVRRCFPTSPVETCIVYRISFIPFIIEFFSVSAILALCAFGIYIWRKRIALANIKSITVPLENEVAKLTEMSATFEDAIPEAPPSRSEPSGVSVKEISQLSLAYQEFWFHSRRLEQAKAEVKVASALNNLSEQVAHDIRSPLSALNFATSALDGFSDEQRSLIRGAIKRINDIAKHLNQRKSTATLSGGEREVVNLQKLVQAMVQEKLIQLRDREDLQIKEDLPDDQNLNVRMNEGELSRALSNLLQNSIEALRNGGTIVVAVRRQQNSSSIVLKDDGPGIPREQLVTLGQRGVSYGKENSESGSGLGLSHAKELVERAGGKFLIQSAVGVGTMVTLIIPLESAN